MEKSHPKNIKINCNVVAFFIDPKTDKILRKQETKNKVVNAGFTKILEGLSGETVPTLLITDIALGTGTTPVTVDDTDLENQTYSQPILAAATKENVLSVDAILDTDVPNGLYTEFGLKFQDGTLWNHAIVDWNKATDVIIFVQTTFTMVNAS